jgi:hypothetical protein
MEIKPPYPVVAPEKTPAILVKKGRRSYADFDVGSKAQDLIQQNKDVEDVVDITPEDIIHINLTYPKTSRSPRDTSAVMYSLSPNRQEKGTVVDVWA